MSIPRRRVVPAFVRQVIDAEVAKAATYEQHAVDALAKGWTTAAVSWYAAAEMLLDYAVRHEAHYLETGRLF
jgi:hypothetical protein